MANWRAETSSECQADFDDLLDVSIELAAEQLCQNWGLDPVAVVNDATGVRRVLSATDADERTGSGTPIRDLLVDDLRHSADGVRSYAIVSNVQVGDEEQIEVLLEHREYALQILIPYDIPNAQTFNLGEMRAAVSRHLLWQ